MVLPFLYILRSLAYLFNYPIIVLIYFVFYLVDFQCFTFLV